MPGLNMAQARKKYGGGPNSGFNASNERSETQQATTRNLNAMRDAAYVNQLKMLMGGPGGGPGGGMGMFGGGGSGGGGGGYGGGGGGPSAYDTWRIAEEKRKRAELDKRKMQLTAALMGARNQALPQLDKYGAQYQKDVQGVYAQNRGLNAGYNRQLQDIAGQMNRGMGGQMDMLQRDLSAQGAVGPEMQAMLMAGQEGQAGTNFLQRNAQGYNTRLAQMMAASQADSRSMGAAIKASSKGQLQNSYANLLAQIGMIGLQ